MFPPASAWAILLLFAEGIDRLQRLNPFPEGGAAHDLAEAAADGIAILLPMAAAVWLLCRRPAFLRLPASASLAATLVRLALSTVALFVAVFLAMLAIYYPSYDPAADHQGQYWIWAGVGGLLHAAALAPVLAILATWRALRERRGNG